MRCFFQYMKPSLLHLLLTVSLLASFVYSGAQSPQSSKITLKCSMAEAEIWINDQMYGRGTWTGDLVAGTYQIDVKREGYQPRSMVITVTANDERTFNVPEPTPVIGHIQIQSTPGNATIYVDGVEVGKTPHLHRGVSGGVHKVEIRMDGYQTYETSVTVENSKVAQVNANLISLGGRAVNRGRSRDMYDEPDRRRDINQLRQEGMNLKVPVYGRSSFYLGAFCTPGELFSYGAQVGFYVSNFNVQGEFGIHERSIQGYWVASGASKESVEGSTFEYVWQFDNTFSVKIGFGIRVARTVRLTPQVGGVVTNLKSSKDELYESEDDNSQKHTFVAGAQGALKLEWIPSRHVSLFAAPSYSSPIIKGEIAKLFDENDNSVSKYAGGFKVYAGLNLIF